MILLYYLLTNMLYFKKWVTWLFDHSAHVPFSKQVTLFQFDS